jgi:hypothetical protein
MRGQAILEAEVVAGFGRVVARSIYGSQSAAAIKQPKPEVVILSRNAIHRQAEAQGDALPHGQCLGSEVGKGDVRAIRGGRTREIQGATAQRRTVPAVGIDVIK